MHFTSLCAYLSLMEHPSGIVIEYNNNKKDKSRVKRKAKLQFAFQEAKYLKENLPKRNTFLLFILMTE